MFVEAISKVKGFTRPIHTISRRYGSTDIEPSAATLFFVNELGFAVTCKHVAAIIAQAEAVNSHYKGFIKEKNLISKKKRRKIRELEREYEIDKTKVIQIKNTFVNCMDKIDEFQIHVHPTEDLAIIKFKGFERLMYKGYAVFMKDMSQVKQGRSLCRLGYPFAEFSNYNYDGESDDIEWSNEGQPITPIFPIDGIMTRNLLGEGGVIRAIEISTPGLKGQSGGPLFNENGLVCGMQSSTHHLHLGFDVNDKEVPVNGKKKKVSNYPFIHLGACVHADIIKSFLREKDVKFYEE